MAVHKQHVRTSVMFVPDSVDRAGQHRWVVVGIPHIGDQDCFRGFVDGCDLEGGRSAVTKRSIRVHRIAHPERISAYQRLEAPSRTAKNAALEITVSIERRAVNQRLELSMKIVDLCV